MPEIRTREDAARVQPPEGWRWTQRIAVVADPYRADARPYLDWGQIAMVNPQTCTMEEMDAAFRALASWMVEYGLTYSSLRNTTRGAWGTPGVGAVLTTSYLVKPALPDEGYDDAVTLWPDNFEFDGVIMRRGQILANGRIVCCSMCGRITPGRMKIVDDVLVCPAHYRLCRGTTPVGRCNAPYIYGAGMGRGCAECYPRSACDGCERMAETAQMLERNGRHYCNTCAVRVCQECGNLVEALRHNDNADLMVCAGCHMILNRRPNVRHEQYDEEVDVVTPRELLIEANPMRPIRFASIEMEIAEGGRAIIEELAAAGLSGYNRIAEYHRGAAYAPGSFCYMERDGSLGEGGGELIFPKMVLDSPQVVENLHRAVKVVRNHVKDGRAIMDLRCGLHIHIDAHKFGVRHTRNLALVFNYLEDPLYRMSAAKYMRHRGFGYAAKLDKHTLEDDQVFGLRFLANNGHAHALHVMNYWNAMRNNCVCGAAVIGHHEKCSCNLGKCTFEFRVFNGTTNFRKIHAYSALALAMVGFARGNNTLRSVDFPEFDYNADAPVNDEMKDKWYERLSWMFSNLYFAENERKSLMYVINNCSMNELGEERINALDRIVFAGRHAEDQPQDMTVARGPEVAADNDPFEEEDYEDDEW